MTVLESSFLFPFGVLEFLLVGLVSLVVPLVLGYWVIRLAVRHGSLDAHRSWEAERVRAQAGVGAERSPNSRS